jgi:YidC/Oxa1 family membrane protein insertase
MSLFNNSPQKPSDPQDTNRMMIALGVSLLILLAWHFGYEKPRQEKQQQQQMEQIAAQKKATAAIPVAAAQPVKTKQAIIAQTKRIAIKGDKISGSISLTGARLDDIQLNNHYTTIDNSQRVSLLAPSGTENAYYLESGWISDDKALSVPDSNTVWSLKAGSKAELVTNGAVTVQWDNGQGFLFERVIALDDQFLFTVTQKITNSSEATTKLRAYHLLSRHSLPADFSGFFILHEGPIGLLNDKIHDPSYKNLNKGDKTDIKDTQGWLGMTDKYWFVGILPAPQERFDARIMGSAVDGKQVYQTDITTPEKTIAAGQSVEDQKSFFVGVKNIDLIHAYQEKYGFKSFDLTFDFGMWSFITKPFFYLIHFLMKTLGNVGMAILGMTVLVRGAMFPLASKSFRSMAGMKKIAAPMKELQAKYGTDKEKLQAEIFELYKREGVNPFSGCWPLLIQVPVFFSLYKVILLSVELRHAPFWGWIKDLSAPDPTNLFTLFGLIPWVPPSVLHIGIWPCLFCLTMIMQKRLSAPMPDPMQERLQGYFPFIITIMLAQFASCLVIYWTWSNVLGVLQQYYLANKISGEKASLIFGHSERRKKKAPVSDKASAGKKHPVKKPVLKVIEHKPKPKPKDKKS